MAQTPADDSPHADRLQDLIRRGEELFSSGDIGLAIDYFKKLLDDYGASAVLHNNLGVAYWQQGQIPDALTHFVAALETDQDHRESYLNVIQVLQSLNRTGEAAALAGSYLIRHPEDMEIRRLIDGPLPREASGPGASEISGAPAQQHDSSIADTSAVPQGRLRVAVFALEPKESACPQLRLLGPLGALSDELEILWANRSDGGAARFSIDLIDTCDLIVVQRLFPGCDTRAICARIVQSGKPIIYEIDDNPLDVPASHPFKETLEAAAPYVVEFISHADGVTVSTQHLAERLAPYHDAITVLNNSIDTNVWCMDVADKTGYVCNETVTIGYAGTPTHGEDLAVVERALRRIVDKYGERVRLVFFGTIPDGFVGHPGVELRTFKADYADYAKELRVSGIDIAIAPLADNEFNRCKSDIKWLEYSACGIPGIYSDLSMYANVIEAGVTGLLADNSEEAWFGAMERLLLDPGLRERLGRQAQAKVRTERTVDRLQSRYLETYRGVLARGKVAEERRVSVSLDYELWKRKHNLTEFGRALWARRSGAPAERVNVQIVVDARHRAVGALARTLESLDRQFYRCFSVTIIGAEEDLHVKCSASLRWVEGGTEDGKALQEVWRNAGTQWVGLVRAGDELADETLAVCVAYLGIHPKWRILYTDEDSVTQRGHRSSPLFKPDVNLDLLRSHAYVGDFCLVRTEDMLADYENLKFEVTGTSDLVLKVLERHGEHAVGHVPHVLYHRGTSEIAKENCLDTSEEYVKVVRSHLQRQGLKAAVWNGPIAHSCTVRYDQAEKPLVSIIVPTRDRVDVLTDCIESVLQKTSYQNYEVIVVDNDSREATTREYLEVIQRRDKRVRVMACPGEFNFSALNNEAARLARGEYLLLLNNDTVVLQEDWIERMVEYGMRDDIGSVGARLVFMNQTLQHAGMVLGIGRVAHHAGYGSELGEPGYMGRGQLPQNFSAVTAACLLVRKDRYFEVGGFDERNFRMLYNDVDFCLKLRRAGYRNLWTPTVSLVHHGSVSLGGGKSPKKLPTLDTETDGMLDKWLAELADDPAYNRNLSLSGNGWELETEVDATWDASFSDTCRIFGIGGGSHGVLEHRMRIPLKALERARLAEASTVPLSADRIRVPSIIELERIRPDTVLAHNAVFDEQLEALAGYRKFGKAFLVFGQDDLMIDLPRTNPFYYTLFKDIRRRLRKAMSSCHRLVVTTDALADAYRGYADDIKVVPNYLSTSVWGNLKSGRRRGSKPRVGWAGAQQHAGDLQILRQVVKATADEVEWVFFGMSLRDFRRYRKELHDAVSFDAYPRALARLNLDLAVAPLQYNRFNECKSNLRLLEYGALGWPVVCTDIEPYRDAPVCRVTNNPKAWINAIRERVYDLDAAEREGDRLRQWVLGGWLLEDHLEDWLSALSPGANKVQQKAGDAQWNDLGGASTLTARVAGNSAAVE